MSQHDLSIANQGFPAFRSDLNSALQALGSLSSGTSAPSTTYANMLWYDSTNNIVKMRNEDNDAWISLLTLDQTADEITYIGALQLALAVTTTGTQTLTNKTLSNPTVTNYVESVVEIGTVSSSSTLSLTNGTLQTATLTASTACTFTMPTATAGKSFVLLLKQAETTGGGSATFTGVKWGSSGAPTITTAAGKMDIVTFVSDGTNWYGSIAQGYTP